MSDTLMATYRRLPVTFERGEGAWLWDTAGKRYLDAIAGIAVCGLGHAHPAVKAAICEQAGTLVHTSNLYGIQQQQILGDNLTRLSGMDRVFFANSGAEANEAAIKIARLYGHRKGIDNPAILVMENSFHGRTLATLSATGNRKVQAGFEPLVQGFVRVPFGDFDAIKEVTQSGASVVAVLVEPVQGEGGVNIPPADYLNNIRTLCDEQGWLMMLDEIQTGMGRTGRMFAHQHNGIQPDVMTLAKGLGNGVPIGACLAKGMAAEVLGPGSHGSTFGGNPLACRVGNSVIETLESDNLVARAATLSERFLAGFEAVFQPNKGVTDIRASGLLIGIELDRPCTELVSQALNEGLLINVTADKIIRLLPPLILTDQEADQIIETVSTLVDNFLSASQPK
ncbi:MAG: aspartate aminotransferase family protein [gamma proteobacterium endosymbiont of Lamellibrachia anaximandri]|nr:aspartate aminotransferase family protein [gamma proteobacterium endosymbiont of Lamellibrachia anaximandri]